MNATTKQHAWETFLRLFGDQNRKRPTRLGVFERRDGETIDYWIESGLPFEGIGVSGGRGGATFPAVELYLGPGGSEGGPSDRLTHTVESARFAKIVLSADGSADGLEIVDAEGKTTVLRFEN